MDNETPTISDLMINAIEENPVTFKDMFDQLLHQKIAAELENAKAYVAQQYFSSEEESQEAEEHQQENQESDEQQSDEQTTEDEHGEDTETV